MNDTKNGVSPRMRRDPQVAEERDEARELLKTRMEEARRALAEGMPLEKVAEIVVRNAKCLFDYLIDSNAALCKELQEGAWKHVSRRGSGTAGKESMR